MKVALRIPVYLCILSDICGKYYYRISLLRVAKIHYLNTDKGSQFSHIPTVIILLNLADQVDKETLRVIAQIGQVI